MLLLSCLLHLNLPDSLLILVLGHLDDALAIFIITGSLLNPSIKQLTKLILVEFNHIVLVFILLSVHVAFVHEILLVFDLIFVTILLLVLAFLIVHLVFIHHLLTFVFLISFLNHDLSAVILVFLLLDAHLVVLVLRDTLASLESLVVFNVILTFAIFLDLTFALVTSFTFFVNVLVVFNALVVLLDLVLLLDVLHLLLLIDSVLREVGGFQVQLIVVLSRNEELTLLVGQVLFGHHTSIFQDSNIPLKLFDLVQVVDERV